jgi:hypothetical protein
MKDYYYCLAEAAQERFVSEPYISLASGNLCRTLSCRFKVPAGEAYTLCMDVKAA